MNGPIEVESIDKVGFFFPITIPMIIDGQINTLHRYVRGKYDELLSLEPAATASNIVAEISSCIYNNGPPLNIIPHHNTCVRVFDRIAY